MSDITITDKLVDKLTEAINKSVKKTLFFEKIEKIEAIAIGFGLYMSFIGIVTMYNSYNINNINNTQAREQWQRNNSFPQNVSRSKTQKDCSAVNLYWTSCCDQNNKDTLHMYHHSIKRI
jgi:hypothetical protein